MKISFELNREMKAVEASPWRRLLDVLRCDIGLTGTKEGCGEGECGACTVLIDDKPVNSCLVPVSQVDGHRVTTVEGLAVGDQLNKIQQAMIDGGGVQCGICSPGIAVCATYVAKHEPNASRERLRELIAGNICRCTGYQLVIDALENAITTIPAQKDSNE